MADFLDEFKDTLSDNAALAVGVPAGAGLLSGIATLNSEKYEDDSEEVRRKKALKNALSAAGATGLAGLSLAGLNAYGDAGNSEGAGENENVTDYSKNVFQNQGSRALDYARSMDGLVSDAFGATGGVDNLGSTSVGLTALGKHKNPDSMFSPTKDLDGYGRVGRGAKNIGRYAALDTLAQLGVLIGGETTGIDAKPQSAIPEIVMGGIGYEAGDAFDKNLKTNAKKLRGKGFGRAAGLLPAIASYLYRANTDDK